ncbi:hypothetical protein RRG08_010812 [Elysia crispata]|uniref:Uncharacterized protein n=1 Tax=Elysia crispata TaxID=231223 RepID=A0AAE0ZF20_9GAST|nr:hypothetical protein RRG08_010812 [Elysia crispata]
MFLRDQEVPRLGSSSFLSEGSTRSSQENSPPECETIPSSHNITSSEITEEDQDFSSSEEEEFSLDINLPSPVQSLSKRGDDSAAAGTSGNSYGNTTTTKRKAATGLFKVVKEPHRVLSEDEHDIYAKTVAIKMRRLSPEQRFFAEKLMNDVMFEAGLEQLSRDSRVVTRTSADWKIEHCSATSYDYENNT